MDVILPPHTESTIERIKGHKVVLAPQDTTTLNYGTHPATMGLGPINNIDGKSMGLIPMIRWPLRRKALCCYYAKMSVPPEKPPTLKQTIRMLGIIGGHWGGHLGRKSDGMPGTECIWRGLERLDTAVDMYAIFKPVPLPQIRKYYPDAYLPPGRGP